MITNWIRRLAIVALVGSFMPGPSVMFVGAFSVTIFDLIFLALLFLLFIQVMLQNRLYIGLSWLSCVGLAFPLSVVLFSCLGAIIYNYPTSYVVGDMRWVQALAVVAVLFHSYQYSADVIEDSRCIFYVGVFFNLILFLLQVNASLTGDPVSFLEWWYKDIPNSAQRPLGFHLNRFSGAIGQPSGLGFFSALTISYTLAEIQKVTIKVTMLVSGMVLLIASGSRTALVATVVATILFLLLVGGRRTIIYISYFILSTIIGVTIAVSFDLGNTVSSNRYVELVKVITGEIDYQEAASRGRPWQEAITKRVENYYILGSLSNPSHIYSGLTIDSGYILSFVRLGVIGLSLMLITFVSPFVHLFLKGVRPTSVIPVLFILVIYTMAINSNTFTDLGAKCFLIYSIFCISISCRKC